MRQQILRLIIAVLVVASVTVTAQQQQPPAGRNAPDIERLRAHITYLASEELEGRMTGTESAEKAATYIAREMAKYGAKPAPPTRSGRDPGVMDVGFLRSIPFVAGVEAGKNNSMSITTSPRAAAPDAPTPTLDLRLKDDWMPLGWSSTGKVRNTPLTFVGYGIVAPDLQHDDYAGVDARGRAVIAFAGTPDGDNPHGQFTRYADARFKASAARERGASALVLIASEDDFKNERLAQLRYDNAGGGDAGLPVVVVSRASARRMLEAGGMPAPPLDELEKMMRAARAQSSAAVAAPWPAITGAGVQQSQPQQTGQPQHAPARQGFSRPLEAVTLDVSTEVVRRDALAFNVVGVFEGSDPQLKREAIVVGAHYDHLGRGGAGSLAARAGEVHHGADDNASGTAGLLELARLLSHARPRRTVVLIAFTGEEEGLLGSNYYVKHPAVPLAQTVAMINMDMIGRLKDDRLIIGGVGTANEWRRLIAEANEGIELRLSGGRAADMSGERRATDGAPAVIGTNGQVMATSHARARFMLTLNEDGFGPSDHSSFYAQKIPVLFFFTGTHEDYHKPTDTADRINYAGEARILELVFHIVDALDRAPVRPTYAVAKSESTGRSTGFRVYLGTVPNYAEGDGGLKLDAVRDDSPAARAGLRAGDVIVKLSGREVRNVYDYTQALSGMRAGEEYEVIVMRGGERLSLKITPAARR